MMPPPCASTRSPAVSRKLTPVASAPEIVPTGPRQLLAPPLLAPLLAPPAEPEDAAPDAPPVLAPPFALTAPLPPPAVLAPPFALIAPLPPPAPLAMPALFAPAALVPADPPTRPPSDDAPP